MRTVLSSSGRRSPALLRTLAAFRRGRWILPAVLLLACSCAPSLDLTVAPTSATRAEFEKYIEINAPSHDRSCVEDAFVAVQRIAFDATQQKRWNDAIAIYQHYRPEFPEMQGRFDTIIALLQAPEDMVLVTNLGDSINSQRDEFLPVITVDGSKLYFCRDNLTTLDDVMASERTATGWSVAQPLPAPIYTMHSEAPTGISPDGNRLLLFGNYVQPSYDSILDEGEVISDGGHVSATMSKRVTGYNIAKKANLFYSDKQADGRWGSVQAFPYPINSGNYESDAKLSSDGKELFFVSDRPGGIGEFHPKQKIELPSLAFHGSLWGNTDIYVSLKQPDGSWGTPINLGPTINTPYAERSPFLHPDGKTLYFSSEGHDGLGGLDIYKSTRLDSNDWTQWSTPVNLGKNINTAGADWGYVISTDGSMAYLSVQDTAHHSYDIVSMTLPKAVRPARVATIAGEITDDKGKPVAATVKWDDLESGKNVGEISSDSTTGKFFIALPMGRNYAYYAQMPGSLPASNSLDLRDTADTVRNLDVKIVLAWIKSLQASDSSIRLNNIFFNFNAATLRPESFSELDRLLTILRPIPDVRVEIDAYTDSKGRHEYNMQLSNRRAQSVADYLISHGMAEARMNAHGFAEANPVATNETDEGRAMNRRVEFRFPRDGEDGPGKPYPLPEAVEHLKALNGQ